MNDFHVVDVPDIIRGSQPIPVGCDYVFVNFGKAIDKNYDVFASVEYEASGNMPLTFGMTVLNKTCFGFNVYLSGSVDDNNYKLNWRLELY